MIGAASVAFRIGSAFVAAVAVSAGAAAQPTARPPFEVHWVEGACNSCSAAWRLGETLFTSRREAWGVGETGPGMSGEGIGARVLLHTSDNGQTWSEVPGTKCYGVSPRVAFQDAKRGWIEAQSDPAGDPVMLRTVDGGATWQDVTGTLPVFPHILDADDWWGITSTPVQTTHGEAWSHALMRTVDAGRHWTRSPVPGGAGDFPIVRMLSPSVGWAGGVTSGGLAVFRTTDGGRTWDESRTRTPSKATQLEDLFFINPRRGWLIVDYTLREDVNGSGSYVLATVDGGKTWARSAVQAIAAEPAFWVRFLSETLGFIFVDRRTDQAKASAVDQPAPSLVYTSDGGSRWDVVTVPDEVAGCQALQGDLVCSARSPRRHLSVLTIHPTR